MPALSTWTPEDGVLGAVAPLALACAAGTALVVDLDPDGPPYPGRTLAELVDDGPTRADLTPARRGIAVLGTGGVEPAAAAEVLAALVEGWPRVVFRLPQWPQPTRSRAIVAVRSLSPLLRPDARPVVYQQSLWRMEPPGPGIVVPRPRASTIRALLSGAVPGPCRWVRCWRRVWEASWD